MIEFEWPWMMLLLPLPLLIRWLAKPLPTDSEAALRVPFLDEFSEQPARKLGTQASAWLQLLVFLAWILLIIASMRPLWLGEYIEFPVSGRDLLLAVDL